MRLSPAVFPAALFAAAVFAAACGDGVGRSACFEDGLPYSYFLGGDADYVFRWPAARQPVRVYAEPVGALQTNTAAAIATWTGGVRCGELRAQMWNDSNTADIIVRNPPIAPPAPKAGLALEADSVGACAGVTYGDIDSTLTMTGPLRSFVWPYSLSDPVALAGCYRMVTRHELGHAFGILNHSPDPNDIMAAQPARSSLSARDRVTIQWLYNDDPTIDPEP